MHISQKNELADTLLSQFMAQSGIVITAYNPYSELLSDEANKKLNSELEHELQTAGYSLFNALGQDGKGEWPGEPSFFVTGIDKNTAEAFAKKYQQNAIVWHEKGSASELLLMR